MLKGKMILVVDDEPDVLETIAEVLDSCVVETAGHFDKALELIRTKCYDMVILDIMGVKGLHLLDAAVRRNFPTVMLTAPAMTPEYIIGSMDKGAISYIPKEELADLDVLLGRLWSIMESGRSPWNHTIERIEPLMIERFGRDWREMHKIQRPSPHESQRGTRPSGECPPSRNHRGRVR